jgi:hypothetical protein
MSSAVGYPRAGGSPDNPSATEGETGKPGPSPVVADARLRPRITDAEWEEFLGHFERRRVALGDCGRAYGTSCIHEHIRCSLLRPDPAQRPRHAGICGNVRDRIAEARQHRWAGEAEGLNVSLAAATAKLTQMDELAARQAAAVDLGMPAFAQAASQTVTAQAVSSRRQAGLTQSPLPQLRAPTQSPGNP